MVEKMVGCSVVMWVVVTAWWKAAMSAVELEIPTVGNLVYKSAARKAALLADS